MAIVETCVPPLNITRPVDWSAKAAELAVRIAPFAAKHDQHRTFVSEAFDLLRAEGFIAAAVPTEFGGGGASHIETGAILTELAKGCPATAVTLSMHYHLVATQVWRHNSGQSAEAVLRKVAANAVLISTGAADWVDSYGEAIRVEGGFQVSARKSPSSGAEVGTILVTSVPWTDGPDGAQVVHCAIPFATEGVEIEQTWDTMGLRGTGSHTVVIDDVFVPDAAVSLIRPSAQWHPVWNAVLGSALPLIMAAYRGVAEAAADLAIAQAAWKVGDPIIESQVGEMLNQLTVVRDTVDAMLASSGNLTFSPTLDHATVTLSRKTVAADAAIRTVRTAMEICGGAGYAASGGVERLYRDVHGALYHPLPGPKQKHFTGRHALGLDPVGG